MYVVYPLAHTVVGSLKTQELLLSVRHSWRHKCLHANAGSSWLLCRLLFNASAWVKVNIRSYNSLAMAPPATTYAHSGSDLTK